MNSIQKFAEFWDIHDLTDSLDELRGSNRTGIYWKRYGNGNSSFILMKPRRLGKSPNSKVSEWLI